MQMPRRPADAGKKSKEQDSKEMIRRHLKAMPADDAASFVDQLSSMLPILRGMIDQSGAAMGP